MQNKKTQAAELAFFILPLLLTCIVMIFLGKIDNK